MAGRPVGFVLAAALLTVLAADSLRAQEGRVAVTSTPPGAVVELVGDYTYRGVTPLKLDRGLAGAYEVRAFKTGYEDWEGRVLISGARRDSIFIRMARKTPLRAGLRSAILPGWGQYYSGQRAKGAAFLIAGAAAMTGVLLSDAERTNAENAVDDAWRAYAAADQIDEIEAAYAELERRHDTLSKWHNYRKRWAYAALAVWLANVADAAALFPAVGEGGHASIPGGDASGFFAALDTDGMRAGLALRF